MELDALDLIIARLQNLNKAIADDGAESPKPDTIEQLTQRFFAMGKIQAAQAILSDVKISAQRHGFKIPAGS